MAVGSFPLSKTLRPRSEDSGFNHRTPNIVSNSNTDADSKLGMARVRSRIYSFGATATTAGAALDGGDVGHQEAMLSATVMDAECRGSAHHTYSASTMPGRGQKGGGQDDNEERASSTECLIGDASNNHDTNGQCTNVNLQTPDREENDAQTDTSTLLGAIDISKVSSNIRTSAPYQSKLYNIVSTKAPCISSEGINTKLSSLL